MSDQCIFVSIELQGKSYLVGRLWFHIHGRHESASFQYSDEWLNNPLRFSLEPALKLDEGSFHTPVGKSLFGSIGDSAPDRWGRILMQRAHFLESKSSNSSLRSLTEIDYLLGVSDFARLGALRFSTSELGPFLSEENTVPPLVELPKLLSISESVMDKTETLEQLKLLLAPGSSLGGARPKATVMDKHNNLLIAKFHRKDDDYNIVLWEAVVLELAVKAGLNVAAFSVETVLDKPILLSQRFDRKAHSRIPFLSAMSMLGAADNEQHSYLEIVDIIRQHGAKPKKDCWELFNRIAFSILVSNTDDHLRNHGFLYDSVDGWVLSPMYDVNPTPAYIRPRVLTTAIDFDNTSASLEILLSISTEFGISLSEAKTSINNIANITSTWRNTAKKYKLTNSEINLISSAFEHEDLTFGKNLF